MLDEIQALPAIEQAWAVRVARYFSRNTCRRPEGSSSVTLSSVTARTVKPPTVSPGLTMCAPSDLRRARRSFSSPVTPMPDTARTADRSEAPRAASPHSRRAPRAPEERRGSRPLAETERVPTRGRGFRRLCMRKCNCSANVDSAGCCEGLSARAGSDCSCATGGVNVEASSQPTVKETAQMTATVRGGLAPWRLPADEADYTDYFIRRLRRLRRFACRVASVPRRARPLSLIF